MKNKSLELIKDIYKIIKNRSNDEYMTNWLIYDLCERHLKENKVDLKEEK